MERWLDAIRAAGREIVEKGDGYMCQCPAHEDNNPSMSLTEGDAGKVLVKCFVGCSFDEIRQSLNFAARTDGGTTTATATRPQRPRKPYPLPTIGQRWGDATVAGVWVYFDEHGNKAQAAIRLEPKSFRQMTPMDDLWVFKGMETKRPLYRLPQIVNSSDQIVIVEGEGTADYLMATWKWMNVTTWIGGAKGWRKTDFTHLKGRTVKLIADADDPGRDAMYQVAKRLNDAGVDVHVALPDGDTGEDVEDWIKRDGAEAAAAKVKELMRPFKDVTYSIKSDDEDRGSNTAARVKARDARRRANTASSTPATLRRGTSPWE